MKPHVAISLAVLVVVTTLRAEPDPDAEKTEIGGVPLVGGDSDIGFGGGALASVTRFEPRHRPFRYKLEIGAVATFKHTDAGWRAPYQDFSVTWTDPHLARNRLRFELRPSYTNETTQAYYGIGNASQAPMRGPEGQTIGTYFQYGRAHPTLLARLRLRLSERIFALTGGSMTYNALDVHPESQLSRDSEGDEGGATGSFRTLAPHLVALFEYALVYDTRDDETTTHTGAYHQVKLRLSPGGVEPFPYRYGQINATLRFYTSALRNRVGFALRLIADGQFGTPPFYELARYEDTFALGGANGVRGVPAQRYYGKVKALANFELRTEIATFRVGQSDYTIGITGFVDAGRVFADWKIDEARDGAGIGLKWGIGGGLRFQQGNAFVVRGDVAWSPDARPIGAYFTAGQSF